MRTHGFVVIAHTEKGRVAVVKSEAEAECASAISDIPRCEDGMTQTKEEVNMWHAARGSAENAHKCSSCSGRYILNFFK